MENNKIFVLLEDDTEILGNGQGHVLYRLYLPVLRYIEILKKFKIKSTFYVDIAHLLFLKENSQINDFDFQALLIEKTILQLLDNEMEIQIHLHSQYVNARIENNQIQVTNKWNIGQLGNDTQKKLFRDAFQCLNEIIQKSSKHNPLNSFKGGSWGLQPFGTLYEEFDKIGIKIVMGPIKGLKVSTLDLDYTTMESDQYPYYCDKLDINKIGAFKGPIVIPMTLTYLNWFDLIRYLIHLKYKRFVKRFDKDLDLYHDNLKSKYFNPLAGKDKLNISLKPFQTHLKINAQPLWFLKKTFKRSYKMVLKNNNPFKLIIIETHTKDFKNNFNDIEKFFDFLSKKYSNIEYITTNQLLSHIKNGKLNPLIKNSHENPK